MFIGVIIRHNNGSECCCPLRIALHTTILLLYLYFPSKVKFESSIFDWYVAHNATGPKTIWYLFHKLNALFINIRLQINNNFHYCFKIELRFIGVAYLFGAWDIRYYENPRFDPFFKPKRKRKTFKWSRVMITWHAWWIWMIF